MLKTWDKALTSAVRPTLIMIIAFSSGEVPRSQQGCYQALSWLHIFKNMLKTNSNQYYTKFNFTKKIALNLTKYKTIFERSRTIIRRIGLTDWLLSNLINV